MPVFNFHWGGGVAEVISRLSPVTPNLLEAKGDFSAETADFLELITTGDGLFTTEAGGATVKLRHDGVLGTITVLTTDDPDGGSECATLNSASISRVFDMMSWHNRKGGARKRITRNTIESGGS